jgi:hypothetical protein
MLKSEASGTDWRLEEYRLLATQVAQRQGFRAGLRRSTVGLLSVLAGLHYLMPRLGTGGALPGPELLAFGVFVVVGGWLLELAQHVSQDRAETRIRGIESALAGGGSRIGHDLRARQRPEPTPASPRLGHVMGGEGRGLARGVWSALRSVSVGGFYLVLLGAFCAWYALADPAPRAGETAPSAPVLSERLEGIETAVREIPERLDRIADAVDGLPEEIARSIPAEPPTILVDVEPPDLAPILRSLDEIRSGLTALEGAVRTLEPSQAEATTPPPAQECEGRAWGIGSSSVSCSSAKP